MKITNITTTSVRIPLKPDYRMVSALGSHDVSDYVLVRVETDEGLEGVGEATVTPRWSGETTWSVRAMVEQLFVPLLRGCDAHDLPTLEARMDAACAGNWFAKAAVEMACWDVQGKAAGKPVYELLGGARRARQVRCRFSMGAYEPQRAAQRAEQLVQAGFETIKVKVGGRPDDDVARVAAVREAIGPDVELVIDANCGWDADTAIACLRQMEGHRVALVEQPTPDGDYGAMARVRRETGATIMADDICFDLVHARELVRNECCDVISLYPGKNGGIRKAREIALFAAEHGIACSVGSNLEWDIATAAMGHLVVATENMQVEKYPGDMLGPTYHQASVAANPLSIKGPLVTVPDGPGLGVDVDWDVVAEHRIG